MFNIYVKESQIRTEKHTIIIVTQYCTLSSIMGYHGHNQPWFLLPHNAALLLSIDLLWPSPRQCPQMQLLRRTGEKRGTIPIGRCQCGTRTHTTAAAASYVDCGNKSDDHCKDTITIIITECPSVIWRSPIKAPYTAAQWLWQWLSTTTSDCFLKGNLDESQNDSLLLNLNS